MNTEIKNSSDHCQLFKNFDSEQSYIIELKLSLHQVDYEPYIKGSMFRGGNAMHNILTRFRIE